MSFEKKKIETPPPPYFAITLGPIKIDRITDRILKAVSKELNLGLSQTIERICGDWWTRCNPRGGRPVPEEA